MAQFPNVPRAPGVPQLLRDVTAALTTTPVLLTADALILANLFSPGVWGLYDANGVPVIYANSIIEVSHRSENRISDAPQEEGGFASYNKVASPYDLRVTLARGGTALDRNNFLAQLSAITAALDLYDLVTPDVVYSGLNVVHFDYRRTQKQGATILIVDIWLQEVRIIANASFTNTASPGGAATVDGGVVQAQPPTPSQVAPGTLSGHF